MNIRKLDDKEVIFLSEEWTTNDLILLRKMIKNKRKSKSNVIASQFLKNKNEIQYNNK